MKRLLIWGFLIGAVILIFNEGNRTKIPLGLKSFDVWVSDLTTGEEYLAGNIRGNYHSGETGLEECRNTASNFADQNNLNSWNYGCCTVTATSRCITRLR